MIDAMNLTWVFVLVIIQFLGVTSVFVKRKREHILSLDCVFDLQKKKQTYS